MNISYSQLDRNGQRKYNIALLVEEAPETPASEIKKRLQEYGTVFSLWTYVDKQEEDLPTRIIGYQVAGVADIKVVSAFDALGITPEGFAYKTKGKMLGYDMDDIVSLLGIYVNIIDHWEWEGLNRDMENYAWMVQALKGLGLEPIPLPDNIIAYLKMVPMISVLDPSKIIPVEKRASSNSGDGIIRGNKYYLPNGLTHQERNWVYLNELGILPWFNIPNQVTSNMRALERIKSAIIKHENIGNKISPILKSFILQEITELDNVYGKDIFMKEKIKVVGEELPSSKPDFTLKRTVDFQTLSTDGFHNLGSVEPLINQQYPDLIKINRNVVLAAMILRAGNIQLPPYKKILLNNPLQPAAWGRDVKTTATEAEIENLSNEIVKLWELEKDPDINNLKEMINRMKDVSNKSHKGQAWRIAYDNLFSVVSDNWIHDTILHSMYILKDDIYVVRFNSAKRGYNPSYGASDSLVSTTWISTAAHDIMGSIRLKRWIANFGPAATVYQLPAGTIIFNNSWGSYISEKEIIVPGEVLNKANKITLSKFLELNFTLKYGSFDWIYSIDSEKINLESEKPFYGSVDSFKDLEATLNKQAAVLDRLHDMRIAMFDAIEALGLTGLTVSEVEIHLDKIARTVSIETDVNVIRFKAAVSDIKLAESEFNHIKWGESISNIRNFLISFKDKFKVSATHVITAGKQFYYKTNLQTGKAGNIYRKYRDPAIKAAWYLEALFILGTMTETFKYYGGEVEEPVTKGKGFFAKIYQLPYMGVTYGEVSINAAIDNFEKVLATPESTREWRIWMKKRIYEISLTDEEAMSAWELLIKYFFYDTYEWISAEDLGNEEWERKRVENGSPYISPGEKATFFGAPDHPLYLSFDGTPEEYVSHKMAGLTDIIFSVLNIITMAYVQVEMMFGAFDYEYELGVGDEVSSWHILEWIEDKYNWVYNQGEGGIEVRSSMGGAWDGIIDSMSDESLVKYVSDLLYFQRGRF